MTDGNSDPAPLYVGFGCKMKVVHGLQLPPTYLPTVMKGMPKRRLNNENPLRLHTIRIPPRLLLLFHQLPLLLHQLPLLLHQLPPPPLLPLFRQLQLHLLLLLHLHQLLAVPVDRQVLKKVLI